MTFITNFFGTYGIKVFLAFVPFLIVVVYFMTSKSSSIKNQEEIKKRFNTLSGTIADKSVAKYLKKQEGKATFLTKINAQLNILGIENKFENLSLYSVALFFVGAVSVNLFIGAGPLLMLYFGFLAIAIVYVLLMNKMDKTRKALKEEFMEKLRDIGAHLSVGLNFITAINESLNSGNTSIVMARELSSVKDDIYSGKSYSETFMKMYERLQISEIKAFAQVCEIYEETGGNFLDIIYAFEDSYKMKRKVLQENEVYEAAMRTEQKFVIGIPSICIVAFGVFMPEIIRGFYSSFFGQVLGIILFSIIYGGILLMSRFVRFRGDE